MFVFGNVNIVTEIKKKIFNFHLELNILFYIVK